MKRIIACISLIAVVYSCNNVTTVSPRSTVMAFIEASKEGNIAEIKKYVTKSDAGFLNMGENMLAKLDPDGSKNMREKMSKEFKEKTKDASFEIKDEKIEGDKAIVNVEFTQEGKSETRPFDLIKEDGLWKISLISTGMKNSGSNQQDINEAMKSINLDSLQGAISEGMEEFNKVNKDSLKKVIEEGMKEIEKLKAPSKEN